MKKKSHSELDWEGNEGRKKKNHGRSISCILRFCLRVRVNWVPSPASARASAGYHSSVSARSLERGGRQSRAWACVENWKETLILAESGRLEVPSRGKTALMTLKIGPWLRYTPSGKSRLQPAVSLSVPLSSHLAPPLCLRAGALPSPRFNFFYEHLFKTSIFQPYSPRRHK